MHILVLVHPGSLCGSAHMNLGRADARIARDAVAQDLSAWTGGIVVIDGDASDELPDYPIFEAAIRNALDRAQAGGLLSVRLPGEDPEQIAAVRSFVTERSLNPETDRFMVTGAWYDPSNRSGCVNSVITELTSMGFAATVSDSAVELDFYAEQDDGHAEG